MSSNTRVQWIDLEALLVGRVATTGQGGVAVAGHHDFFARFKAAVSNRVQTVGAAWMRWHSIRRTEAQLRSCSDSVLKDIGIHRSEIGSLASAAGERRRANLDLRPRQDRF